MTCESELSLTSMFKGAVVSNIYSHHGTPGGHNNDRVRISFDDGRVLSLDAYSPGYMTVEIDGKEVDL